MIELLQLGNVKYTISKIPTYQVCNIITVILKVKFWQPQLPATLNLTFYSGVSAVNPGHTNLPYSCSPV